MRVHLHVLVDEDTKRQMDEVARVNRRTLGAQIEQAWAEWYRFRYPQMRPAKMGDDGQG